MVRLEFPERERGWAPEVEVRPYAVPMHRAIPGLGEVPHRIGVALMNPLGRGRVHADGSVDLPDDPGDATALAEATAFVAERLGIDGTVTRDGQDAEIVTKGRHDPCVGIRAVPVAEAMAACVILDHLLLDRAQTGGMRGRIG